MNSYDFLWLSLALFPLVSLAFLIPIVPNDYWWYLRVARDTLQSGMVPVADTMSYTFAGRPIVYQGWLSALLFYAAHQTGGATLTFLLRGLSIGITYGLLWALMRESGAGPRLSSLLIFLLGLATSNNWSMRPQILAYPLFLLVLWVLWRWQTGRSSKMWLLPIASLLWTNAHGSFVLAFILMGSALIFGKGDRRQLALWMVLSALATLANPRGPDVWRYVADMLRSSSDQLYATEWGPPVNQGWQMNIFFAWLLALIPLAAISPRRLSTLEWIWLLGLGWMALSGMRYVIWFTFLAALVSAGLLSQWTNRFFDSPNLTLPHPSLNVTIGAAFMLMPLLLLPGVRDQWWAMQPPAYDPTTTPIEATEWLAAHPDLPGPMFNDYIFGSYLAFALPTRPVWIDSRFPAYPPDHWDTYRFISLARWDWESLLAQDHVNLLLLSATRQAELIRAVESSGTWCEQYRDADAVVYTRRVAGQTYP